MFITRVISGGSMPGMSVRHKKLIGITLEPALLQQAVMQVLICRRLTYRRAERGNPVPQALNAGSRK